MSVGHAWQHGEQHTGEGYWTWELLVLWHACKWIGEGVVGWAKLGLLWRAASRGRQGHT